MSKFSHYLVPHYTSNANLCEQHRDNYSYPSGLMSLVRKATGSRVCGVTLPMNQALLNMSFCAMSVSKKSLKPYKKEKNAIHEIVT